MFRPSMKKYEVTQTDEKTKFIFLINKLIKAPSLL